jgi:hypothetical protein
VARLVGDQLEQHEAQFAAVEHPPPPAAASEARTVFVPASFAFVAAVPAAARSSVMAIEAAAVAALTHRVSESKHVFLSLVLFRSV